MEEVKCPKCNSSGETVTATGRKSKCYVCGGKGFVAADDLEWAQKWAVDGKRRKPKSAAVAAEKKPVTRRAATVKAAKAAPAPAPDDGRTPLHLAAADVFARETQTLIAAGADVNARDAKGRTPLHWPAFRGHLAVVKALIAAGADINAQDDNGRTPLQMAKIGEQEAVTMVLRERMQ